MTDTSLFDYHLPETLIAQHPARHRTGSRLMTLNRSTGSFAHTQFRLFPELLRDGDMLVLNTTRVFPARLVATRSSGGKAELLLVHPKGNGVWLTMVRGLAKLKTGETLSVGDGSVTLIEKLDNGTARIDFGSDDEVSHLTEKFGQIPLPPYIHREGARTNDEDTERYQTTYADTKGSCAAPTAGLHFTDELLGSIESKGINTIKIIHHVGPGTFKPIKTDTIENHVMDMERMEISEKAAHDINQAKAQSRRVVAVGSTVTRALESAAVTDGKVKAGAMETSLYITPGHKFKVVDALLTNFHLPKSTLMVLVSAFAGRETIMQAYTEAITEKYRFFSYGDAMFIE